MLNLGLSKEYTTGAEDLLLIYMVFVQNFDTFNSNHKGFAIMKSILNIIQGMI